jgi:hypothetical protein
MNRLDHGVHAVRRHGNVGPGHSPAGRNGESNLARNQPHRRARSTGRTRRSRCPGPRVRSRMAVVTRLRPDRSVGTANNESTNSRERPISSSWQYLLLITLQFYTRDRSMEKKCPVGTIHHRYTGGRFAMSPHGVTVSNRSYLSISETRVHAGIRR